MNPAWPSNFSSHRYQALTDGPRLIVTGAVHGNEVCGAIAIRRLMAELEQGARSLVRGMLTLVPVANPLAYRLGQRGGERNLNRNLAPQPNPQDYEDHVANWLCPLLAEHEALLDLHSFQSPGQPFVFLGPPDNAGTLEPFSHAAKEEALARCLGVSRAMDGWLSTYALGVERRQSAAQGDARQRALNSDVRYGVGTTEYMRSQGGWALTLECGQHDDPAAPEVSYRAVVNTLAHLGMIRSPAPKPQTLQGLSLYEVVDKQHDADRFVRDWASFDPVRRGETIAVRADGKALLAPEDGCIVFPSPGAPPGQEWFYLARPSARW
ncbi:succinylglutamate desuccinylase/aspartoacylase domain-containing protein [Chromobacterium amazonense]|uniref:Succinylglutamate desuccinylase/aspartoacylase family protein n=1 Tax=Chromobacterium amazonense TaxID=1382803 RepID=A0ABU8V3X6_9NEIS|nr:succinylglutamate desuccinylase/aspartoacylase family protein [Chromobacterium amazonense]MDQ4539582.1 succinylglutamate desuccinylase/aspartoacylase family protein [Chromobacterium amazonense]